MNQLKEMLEAYRNGERGLPTYAELAEVSEAAIEMTARDQFAAKAMQSLLLLPEYVSNWTADVAARDAYQFADAMLAERAK